MAQQVMVIDQEPAMRATIEAMLREASISVVADSGYGVEASSLAEETKPDVILASVEHPTDRALRTLRAVTEIVPDARIVVYSGEQDMDVMRQVMQIGVQDFLPTPLSREDVIAAIGVADAAPVLTPALSGRAPAADPAQAAGIVLTVFGAKGGIGKSTTATNIATAIAQETDLSVLIMDLDTRFGDIAIMMDIEPRFTVSDLAASIDVLDRETFRSALMEHESGVSVLSAPEHPSEWRNITAEQMTELIQFGARLFDYVILDTPSTLNDIVATAIEVAHKVLVISSLDTASIKDTAYMLALLEAEGVPSERLLLTINQVNRANTIKTSDVHRVVHHEVYFEIDYDEQILRASQVGQPVVLAKPRSRPSKQFRELAGMITGGVAGQRSERSKSDGGRRGGIRGLLALGRSA